MTNTTLDPKPALTIPLSGNDSKSDRLSVPLKWHGGKHYLAKGKVILSGYPSDLYNAMLQPRQWHQIQFDLPNNAAGGKAKRRMTECLWLNYEPTIG